MSKVIVLGGANIDIIGQSDTSLIEYDSNPGRIRFSYGGVGRNIAENCCRLKEQVMFATVFGKDLFAKTLQEHCLSLGMDLSLCQISPAGTTSTYLAVLDHNQDMKVAISDMNLLKEVDQKMIDRVLAACEAKDILVMDTNLEQDVIEAIARRAPCPIVMDPISCAKAIKVKNCLSRIHTFKPNRYEAQLLCGFEISKEEDQIKAARWFLDQGVKEVFISLGEEGTIAANCKEMVIIRPKPVELVNATGGGDSFLAALIAYRHLGLMQRCELATSLAISTISVEETVNSSISREWLETNQKKLEMEGRKYVYSN